MVDPVSWLLLAIESDVARLPAAAGGSAERPGGGRGETSTKQREARWKELFGRPVPPGYAAFLERHDGWTLGEGVRVLSWDESLRHFQGAGRGTEGTLKGLWPVVKRDTRLFALDAEGAGDPEWPVVEVSERSVDRAGSTFLRFLHGLLAELTAPEDRDPVVVAREVCRRDPFLAAHWVELADQLERLGRWDELDAAVVEGMRAANPPGTALAMMAALRALSRSEPAQAEAALEEALALEPLTGRDDDARLDAAAVLLVRALETGDESAVARARDVLGAATASTGAYWRGELLRAVAEGQGVRAALAARVVTALVPEDTDVDRLRASDPHLVEAVRATLEAREALDRGAAEEAAQKARAAVARKPDLGVSHALLAEALNASRDRGALEAARRATELNPALVEAWRELGDAYLEMRQAGKAEEAYRKAIARDGAYGLGMAKLAQALLEQGRTLEALEAISGAQERGGDGFFLAAVRGDILAEMSRHQEAAEAYDQALRLEPEDHWVLHQAAIEYSRAGEAVRAVELFERALLHDREGCHQTLVDYGDLLRRVGRIGDAVRMYRKAVAACPSDVEWRQMLREAERELMAAPN